MKSFRLLAPFAALALLVSACGGADEDPATDSAPWAVNNCALIADYTGADEPAAGSTIEGAVAVASTDDSAPTISIAAEATPATSLQTIDLIEGTGDPVAAGANITVEYCGVGLSSRKVFDSSWSRGEPASFPLSGVIPGWQEGIPGMKPGGERLLIIPGPLAYGPNPPSADILPDETLVCVVTLISDDTPKPLTQAWAISDCTEVGGGTGADAPAPDSTVEGPVAVAGQMEEAPTVSIEADATPATTLQTIDLTTGSGPEVAAGASVTVQYCGLGLTSRRVFDSSWARGEPVSFGLDGVIVGWQEGIPGMQVGGRRVLVIPGDLAYGPTPPGAGILPDETLVFVVDLLAIDS